MRRNNKDWTAAGADKVPPIITRGVLIDLAGEKQLDVLLDAYEITPTDLKRALAAQKLSLHARDAVFIRTGRMTVWPAPGAFVPHERGIGLAGAEWLVAQGAIRQYRRGAIPDQRETGTR